MILAGHLVPAGFLRDADEWYKQLDVQDALCPSSLAM